MKKITKDQSVGFIKCSKSLFRFSKNRVGLFVMNQSKHNIISSGDILEVEKQKKYIPGMFICSKVNGEIMCGLLEDSFGKKSMSPIGLKSRKKEVVVVDTDIIGKVINHKEGSKYKK